MRKRIFISYASQDLHDADKVCSLLEADGTREAVANDETFDALWQEGRSMSLDQAVQYALAATSADKD